MSPKQLNCSPNKEEVEGGNPVRQEEQTIEAPKALQPETLQLERL